MSEQPPSSGLPPMDAVWWQQYSDLYREVLDVHHRLVNLDQSLFEPEEVFHLGLFMGMTSRILAEIGQEREE